MSTVEQITEHTRHLPESAQREILHFVEFILSKYSRAFTLALTAKRPIGLAKGEFKLSNTFFEPLPDEMLDAFEGR